MSVESARLYKFCKSIHNINKGGNILVGNLYKYRTIDQIELIDPHEGKYEFNISFPGKREFDFKWINLLFQGAIGFSSKHPAPRIPANVSVSIEKLTILSRSDDSVTISDASVSIQINVPNSLIFCMTYIDGLEKDIFTQYDDKWSIPFKSADKFAAILGSQILNTTPLSHFMNPYLASLPIPIVSQSNFLCKHGHVIYQDKNVIINDTDAPSYNLLLSIMNNISMIKPKKHSEEMEYRFIFELVNNGYINSAPQKDLFVPLNLMHHFL